MNIREEWEAFEKQTLAANAVLSINSKGRVYPEEKCDIRTDFQRDKDRIVHSKAFRRLMHKTQVFISPGDHYRTRLTHTLEVSGIARTIARSLRVNEDLTEAIALGHDLGHTPFGHSGEKVIDDILKKSGLQFSHNLQSIRVVEQLEKNGQGLNLTLEVKDGILGHSWSFPEPFTEEGKIVRLSDRIAYLNHDIDDAVRGKVIREVDLPYDSLKILGYSHSKRINKMVEAIIYESKKQGKVAIDKETLEAMNHLRNFMFDNVYIDSKAKYEEAKVKRLLTELFEYYLENENNLPDEYLQREDKLIIKITDYISGMTDSYAIKKFKEVFLPREYKVNR